MAVNQHRRVEIAIGEHADNMLKVVPYLLEANRVFDIVDANFNQTSVLCEDEMVGRLVMREAHDLVAVLVDCGVMVLRHVLLLAVGKTDSEKDSYGDSQHESSPNSLYGFGGPECKL